MQRLVFRYFCSLVFVFIFTAVAQANIVLKVIAINPSKTQTQKAQIKAYLPKEAKPEDVVDKGDLGIAYDNQQGSYYVFGEYEIKPSEVLDRDIEIKDIWVIRGEEIESLRQESAKIMGLLKDTEFAERVSFINNNIQSRLNTITENQLVSPANPERHISEYRDNLKILETVKTDLLVARSLLSQAKPFPTLIVWRLIIFIVIFLGALGITFYFIWQKEAKVITEGAFYIPKKEAGTSGESEPKRHEAEGETEVKPADIEKIIKDETKET